MAGDKPTSRREFLRGKSAGRALLDAANRLADRTAGALDSLAPGAPPLLASPGGTAAAARLKTSRRAMACEFAVEHHAADGAKASDAALAALDLIEQLEDQLSIYRPHTEVSALNRHAAEDAVVVEPQLFALIQNCVRWSELTGGAFDMTSGPLSRAWGFLRREGRPPAEAELAGARVLVGIQHLLLDDDCGSVRFLKAGVEINFNSVGKGYALDRAAELLDSRGVDDYLCHGGGSSVLARGRDRGGRYGGWSVAVPHPTKADAPIGEIVLRDEALGTSGSGTQFFEHEGRRFGHLIDPRIGWPAEGVFTATAVAKTAAEADALATAFYIMGPGGTSEYCAEHPDVGAVMVCPGVNGSVDVHAFNVDGGRWFPR